MSFLHTVSILFNIFCALKVHKYIGSCCSITDRISDWSMSFWFRNKKKFDDICGSFSLLLSSMKFQRFIYVNVRVEHWKKWDYFTSDRIKTPNSYQNQAIPTLFAIRIIQLVYIIYFHVGKPSFFKGFINWCFCCWVR